MILLAVGSCVKELESDSRSPEIRTVRLTVNAQISPFDGQEGTKAAPALVWSPLDRIYMRMTGAYGETKGFARYENDGTWSFTYSGPLAARTDRVECYYLQNVSSQTYYQVSLSYSSIVYADESATLTVDQDGNAALNVYLKPKTGRLSLHPAANGNVSSVGLSGIAWYTSFDIERFQFTTVEGYIPSLPVSADSYVYGFFPEGSERKLVVRYENEADNTLYFSRVCSEAVLLAGHSGYMTVPTYNQYEGWKLENAADVEGDYLPIDFADPDFKAWLVLRYDTDGDGEISRMEARNVTEINNSQSTDVTSLGGIEYFVNLQSLTWTGYETWEDDGHHVYSLLTDVDLTNNTSLRTLNLSCNQLTSLDLSQNTVLEEFNLNWNQLTSLPLSLNAPLRSVSVSQNQLSALDLSGFSNLRYLDCNNNLLTDLRVAGLSSLENLYCYHNQLSSLDISGCPNLRYLNFGDNQISSVDLSSVVLLESLDCYGNQLSSLDVRSCTHLRWLQTVNNQLGVLDLSGLTELNDLYLWNSGLTSLNVSGCTALRQLNCTSNELKTLDLSGLSALESAYVESNQLTTLIVAGDTALQQLYCCGNQLTDLDVSGLSSLRELSCYSNQITALNLNGLSSLETVSCQNNQLTSLSLLGCGKLNYLDFSTNQFADIDLSACPLLRDIHGGWNPFTSINVSSLTALEYLSLEYSKLRTLDLTANSALTYLNTSGSEGLATITVKKGQTFPNGLSIDGTTEIVYQD